MDRMRNDALHLKKCANGGKVTGWAKLCTYLMGNVLLIYLPGDYLWTHGSRLGYCSRERWVHICNCLRATHW